MNNLISLLSKYNGKVARVLCHPSFVNCVIAGIDTRERPTQVGGCPMAEVEMREEYRLELTDGRVVHQDGSVDESPLTQFMRSRGQEAVYRELVTLGLRAGGDEHRVKIAVRRAEREVKAVANHMIANLRADSYRKSHT